jgi:hypothetical protein
MTREETNQNLRVAVGVAIGLAALAFLSDSPIDIIPIAVLAVGMLSYSFLDDRYSLPDGTDSVAYGAGVSLAGAGFFLAHSSVLVSVALAVIGVWFIFDGVTVILYGEESTEHEYVTKASEDSEEVMSRMMRLRETYTALRDCSGPRTPEELAEEHNLDEEHTVSALEYLETKGRVSGEGGRYRVEPQRWGKLTPVVEFLTWLPRRFLLPFYRTTTGGKDSS